MRKPIVAAALLGLLAVLILLRFGAGADSTVDVEATGGGGDLVAPRDAARRPVSATAPAPESRPSVTTRPASGPATGRLELTFADAARRPVAGIAVEIVETGDGAVADADGRLHVDLPPGTWRWRALTKRSLVMVPAEARAHFEPILRNDRPGWRAAAAAGAADVSGPFTLEAGRTLSLDVFVWSGTLIDGYLPPATDGRRIGLYDWEALQHPAGRGGDLYRMVQTASATVDDLGHFAFRDVRPGAKVLLASWHVGDDHYFARVALTLEADESKHLGSLTPLVGRPVSLEIVVRDGDGVIDPQSAWGAAADRLTAGMVLSYDDATSIDAAEENVCVVPLGRPVRLHGLTAGRWTVTAGRHPDWPRLPRPVPQTAPAVLLVPAAGAGAARFEYHMPRDDRVRIGLVLTLPRDVAAQRLSGALIGADRSVASFTILEGDFERGTARIEQHVRPGPWHLLVRSAAEPGEEARAGVQGFRALEVREPADWSLALEAGVLFEGRARRPDGAPHVGTLMLRPEWPAVDVWFVSTTTDPAGRFAIGGLVPALVWEVAGSKQRLDARAPPPEIVIE